MDKTNNRRKDRRSCVIIDNVIHGAPGRLANSQSEKTLFLDECEQSCTQTLDALSLESTVVWSRGKFVRQSFAVRPVHFSARSDVQEILNEVINIVVDHGEQKRRERNVENYLEQHLPGPLVQRTEVSQIGTCLSTAAGALYGSSNRLYAAWRIILVSSAQQLCQSFSRILCRKNAELQEELDLLGLEPRSLLTDTEGLLVLLLQERVRLKSIEAQKTDNPQLENTQSGRADNANSPKTDNIGDACLSSCTSIATLFDPDQDSVASGLVRKFSAESFQELRDVTDRILDLTVLYLKNAARDVIDSAVDDVKNILNENTRL